MIRSRLLLPLLCFLLLVPPAFATGLVGRDLLIPFAGRAPGAFGSQWRTDVVVSNLGASPVSIGLILRNDTLFDFGPFVPQTLEAGQTIVMKDIIRTRFGEETGGGYIRVTATAADAKISAHARIYNTSGAAGEYGQIANAVPLVSLGHEASLAGLSGIDGNRTNMGLTNPDMKIRPR